MEFYNGLRLLLNSLDRLFCNENKNCDEIKDAVGTFVILHKTDVETDDIDVFKREILQYNGGCLDLTEELIDLLFTEI